MHVMGSGDAVKLAQAAHAALVLSKTPLKAAKPKAKDEKVPFDTAALDAAIGASGKVDGGVWKYSISPKYTVTENGMTIPASMGTATAFAFTLARGLRTGLTRWASRGMTRRFVITVAVALGAAATAFAAFSTAGVRDDAAPTTTVKVGVREWAFDLSQESAPVGAVTFAITNTGQSEPHDFAVNGRTSAVLMPGESTTLTVDFNQPGVYPYVDTRADTDREMYGSFTVTGTAVTTRRPRPSRKRRRPRRRPSPGRACR